MYQNRTAAGVLALRDVTHAIAQQNWAPGPGNYDQELGDLDFDGDLDIFGANWITLDDAQVFNRGDGTFDPGLIVPDSLARQIEAELLDYDNDGDLDALVISEKIEDRIYANAGALAGHTLALEALAVPVITANGQGADARDVDQDSDCDVLVATILFEADVFYRNVTGIADTHAPRVVALEQAPDRAQGTQPTVVRVQVYDNAAWYTSATYAVQLEFATSTGSSGSVPMRWAGGQVFRGELGGALHGLVTYRAAASDESGNSAASAWLAFQSSCTGMPTAYCSAKVNSQGCTPAMQWQGAPSASSTQPFLLQAVQVLNNKAGFLFYGFAPDAQPFSGGTLCVQAPLRRTQVQNSGGSPPPEDCSGVFAFDFNQHVRLGVDPNLVVGAAVFAQHWYRDPSASHNSGLTDALRLALCP